MRLIWVGAALAASAGLLLWRPWTGEAARGPSVAPPGSSIAATGDPEALKARADRLIAERGVRPENLSEAVELLAACQEILKPRAVRDPGPYMAAKEARQEALRLWDRTLEDLWVEYQRCANLRDGRGAQAALRQILRAAPRGDDLRNRRARSELARRLSSPE